MECVVSLLHVYFKLYNGCFSWVLTCFFLHQITAIIPRLFLFGKWDSKPRGRIKDMGGWSLFFSALLFFFSSLCVSYNNELWCMVPASALAPFFPLIVLSVHVSARSHNLSFENWRTRENEETSSTVLPLEYNHFNHCCITFQPFLPVSMFLHDVPNSTHWVLAVCQAQAHALPLTRITSFHSPNSPVQVLTLSVL